MKFLGFVADSASGQGGSTYDALTDPGPLAVPEPDEFFPVVSAQVEPGYEDRARNDEVRGRRAGIAPYPWRAAPTLTFRSRLYPGVGKWVLPRALGGERTTDGTEGAPITTTFEPAGHNVILPSVNAVLVRDEQIDYLYGLWIAETTIEVTTESEVFVAATLRALYHHTVPLTSEEFTPDTSDHLDPYAGVTLNVSTGPSGDLTPIDCISNLTFTFNNTLSEDDDVRYCKGRNVVKIPVNDGAAYRYRQYPTRHKTGRQNITGSLGFGTVQPSLEERRLLTQARVLQADLTGNPLDTDPEADELIRFLFHSHVLTGGSAGELIEEGEIKSSYEFSAHLDPTENKDLELSFVDAAEVPAVSS